MRTIISITVTNQNVLPSGLKIDCSGKTKKVTTLLAINMIIMIE